MFWARQGGLKKNVINCKTHNDKHGAKRNFAFMFVLFFLSTVFSLFAGIPFRIMFYNTENFFDTINNPENFDNEYTPEGFWHWNSIYYYVKLNNLAKVIKVVGGERFPILVGMCEVENDLVVDDLTHTSPLRKAEYQYIVTKSEDRRGINVALLYQQKRFRYICHDCIRISFPNGKQKRTRDVLHVTGRVSTRDTLDVFVCHFPSRREGKWRSEIYRMHVASVIRRKADSLMIVRKNANILIMGDFNDEPSDKSLVNKLTNKPINGINKLALYNLFAKTNGMHGSYKFKKQWYLFDQIIVSGNLLNQGNLFHVLSGTAAIFNADFLFIDSKSKSGKRPYKTFYGWKYEGGYSDHLPVFVDFVLQ